MNEEQQERRPRCACSNPDAHPMNNDGNIQCSNPAHPNNGTPEVCMPCLFGCMP